MIHQKDYNQNNYIEDKSSENIFINKNENLIYEKNIEYLVNEIKEAEKKIKKELKESIFNKKNIPKIPTPEIELTPINIQTIQYILSSKIRNQNMLIVLNTFLSNMKFVSVTPDLNDRKKLISSLSSCLKLEKKQKGSILFRYGNKGNRFYVVLSGEISVLILKEVDVELTFLNYIKYLLYLKVIKEDELAKKIIATNSITNFKLTERHLDKYYEDILSFINKYYSITSFNINEFQEKKIMSVKKIYKLGSRFNSFVDNEFNFKNEYKIDNIKQINSHLRLSAKDFKSFRRQYTIDESKLNSDVLHKSNILSMQKKEEADEILEEKVKQGKEKVWKNKEENEELGLTSNSQLIDDLKQKEEGSKIIKEVDNNLENNREELFEINDESNPKIKYMAKSKIPNYFELDIGSLGPYDLANLINFMILNLENFSHRVTKVNSVEEYIKMCSIDENLKIIDKNKKIEKLTIFKYFEITKKLEGEIFGELALQHEDNKRTATMIVTKDSTFGYISKSDYNLSLKTIEIKKRKRDINFIMSFSLFGEKSWVNFEKQYFNFFKKENLVSGQTIINQNESIENIYFIMKGQIEISTKLSIHDITEIIKQKNKRINLENCEKIEFVKDDNEKYEKDDIESINKTENLKEPNKNNKETIKIGKYMFLNKKFIKEMREIKNYRLCVVDNKDIIGLNDICNEPKISFVKATCISSEAIVFSIKINILEQLRKKNKKINKNVQEIYQKRENLMIERLKSVINQTKMKVKQNQMKNISNIKTDGNELTNREKRIITALKTQYSEAKNYEFGNTLYNYKNEIIKISPIKINLHNNFLLLGNKSKKKIYIKNQNKEINNNTLNENNKNKKSKKTGFVKFMESVAKRVNQINKHVSYSKFSKLFCPIYSKKSKLNSDKMDISNLKEIDIKNNKITIENNIINIAKDINKKNRRNFSPLLINQKDNQIKYNKSIYKLIKTQNPKENISIPELRQKQNLIEKLSKTICIENSKKNIKDFTKKNLDKEDKIQKEKKNFIKMLIPNIEKAQFSRNYKNIKFKTLEIERDEEIKPAKVDLLLHYKISKEKASNYLKDIFSQKAFKYKIKTTYFKK